MVWSPLPEREAEIVGKDKDGVARKQEDKCTIFQIHPPRNRRSFEVPRLVGREAEL